MLNYFKIFIPETNQNHKRILFKSMLIIGAGHLFLGYVSFVMNLNTPEFVINLIHIPNKIKQNLIYCHRCNELR
jgi:hypothetical protein